jgi:hypothetical protein
MELPTVNYVVALPGITDAVAPENYTLNPTPNTLILMACYTRTSLNRFSWRLHLIVNNWRP